jgi:hypothetical protein
LVRSHWVRSSSVVGIPADGFPLLRGLQTRLNNLYDEL